MTPTVPYTRNPQIITIEFDLQRIRAIKKLQRHQINYCCSTLPLPALPLTLMTLSFSSAAVVVAAGGALPSTDSPARAVRPAAARRSQCPDVEVQRGPLCPTAHKRLGQ